MAELDVETAVHPPEPDVYGDDSEPSMRVSVSVLDVGDALFEAGVQLFGADADDPERFAEALLAAALAVATLRGSDHAWAAASRFAAYDGSGGARDA